MNTYQAVCSITALSFILSACAYPPPRAQNNKQPYVVYNQTGQNITDKMLTNLSPHCKDYVGSYYAYAKDDHKDKTWNAYLTITAENNTCIFTSNAIPNHNFNNADKHFPNQVKPQFQQYIITDHPKTATHTTPLTLDRDNAIFLNGVKVDVLAAGCYGVGDGYIGCNHPNQPWRYDPAYKSGRFIIDLHNAHAQPDGTYHYHATPNALFNDKPATASPVIGFAADGFPIYGSFIKKNGQIVAVKSSYQLKKGRRPSGAGNPGGYYNGLFRDDYVYVPKSGDLDQCNGMQYHGSYAYFVTQTFPYIINCFKGTPNPSFNKPRPGHHRHQ